MGNAKTREKAQDLLLEAASKAMYILDDEDISDAERAKIRSQVVKQFGRIQKLFGYDGSWRLA
jgi:hypothetical protein